MIYYGQDPDYTLAILWRTLSLYFQSPQGYNSIFNKYFQDRYRTYIIEYRRGLEGIYLR